MTPVVALAAAFVTLRPKADVSEFKTVGAKAGKAAGDAAGKGVEQGIDEGLERAKARAAANGGAAGKAWGDGFHRDSAGKIRDAQGKFVASSITGGDAAGRGYAKGFNKGSSGIVASIKANLGAAAGLFVPVALGAAVAQIGTIGMAYEDNLNIFKAVTKATGDQMTLVSAKARQLGSDVQLPGVSAAGAAAAMTELAKSGLSVSQAMDAAKGTLQLARVASLSEAQAAEITGNAINAFGLKAKDATFVVDELAAAANSSSVEVSEVSASFKMAAAVFSAFQGPAVGSKEAITELNTAIAILGNNGIKGSDAGTSLKQMLLQLTGPADQAKAQMALLAQKAAGANISLKEQTEVLHGSKKVRNEALASIASHNKGMELGGDIAFTSAGKMRPLKDIIALTAAGTKNMTEEERLYAITQIFGADASRAVIALMKGGLPTYEKQRQAVLATGAAASFAAAKNAGLKGAIDNVRSQIENASISIYNAVKGPLTSALNSFAAALPGIFAAAGRVFSFIGQHATSFKVLAGVIAALIVVTRLHTAAMAAQAAGGFVAWIVQWVTQMRVAVAVQKVWTALQWAFNAALAANPIGIAVVAIAALVAAIVIAYKNSETFRNVVQAVWAAIKVAVAAVVNWFTSTVLPVLQTVWAGIAAGAVWLWNTVLKPVFTALKTFLQTVVFPVFTWLYDNIVKPVFHNVATTIKAAWVVIQVIFKLWVATLRAVVFPVLNFLWNNVVKPVFSNVMVFIKAAWVVIQVVFKLWMAYLKNVLFPVIRFLWNNVVKPVFQALGAYIGFVWNNVIKPVFNFLKAAFGVVGDAIRLVWNNVVKPVLSALGSFIKEKVAPGFKLGVDAIKATWEKIKAVLSAPIRFMVDVVVNKGIIGGINWLADKVGVKDRIPDLVIPGLARGGQIPGAPSERDNVLAKIAGSGKLLKVATGEFITRTRSARANLPLLDRVNRLGRKATAQDLVDVVPDGMADGGLLGAVKSPAGWLARRMGLGGLTARFGDNPLVRTVLGAAGRMKDMVKEKIKSLVGKAVGFLGVGGKSGMGYKAQQAAITAAFPELRNSMISGFRRGSMTLTGNRSYHASGRAVDYPAIHALAAWIKANYGAKTKELITPWQELNLHNGQPHTYHGAVWNQHNFAGGNAHVHWAMAMGGLLDRLAGLGPMQLMDSGGTLRPGANLVYNGLGRPERLVRADQQGRPVIVLNNYGWIGSQGQVSDMVAKGYHQAVKERKIRPAGA